MEVKNKLENRIRAKVNQLTVQQIEQVEQFIDSLTEKDLDTQLSSASSKMAESTFERVWNNSEDAEYDKL